MQYEEALEYIKNIEVNLGSDYSLRDVTELCNRVGRPDDRIKVIHIAGTNGKGSVGTYLASILTESGYRVGRYLSPTILDYRERIQKLEKRKKQEDVAKDEDIECKDPVKAEQKKQLLQENFVLRKRLLIEQMKGCFAQKEEIARCLTLLRSICDQMVREGFGQPTAFEIETVMAFMLFEEWNVDIAIVECGLGGRMDATNFITDPFLCLFTSISMDHMGILGNTKEEIAKEKYGIIKKKTTVVSLKQDFSTQILEQICNEREAELYFCDTKQITHKKLCLNRNTFSFLGEEYVLKQNGGYQIENAALAILAAKVLKAKGMHSITVSHVQKALEESFWYGRFELLSDKPCMLVDGAHNEDGALRLKESLETYFPEEKCIFIIGMFQDKAYDKVLEIMLPLAKSVYTVSTKGKRKLAAKELSHRAGALRQDILIQPCDSMHEAIRRAKKEALENENKDKIILFGTLSLIHEIYQEMQR